LIRIVKVVYSNDLNGIDSRSIIFLNFDTNLITDMKKNVGNIDKIIRLSVAAIILVLFLTDVITGTLGIILLFLAGIFTLTSLLGFCPLYVPIGATTCKKDLKR